MARVLIVDDAAFMRISIKNTLSKNGYEIAGEAENGLVAIENTRN
jgi:two-component system chemotaxis response regulator CheY